MKNTNKLNKTDDIHISIFTTAITYPFDKNHAEYIIVYPDDEIYPHYIISKIFYDNKKKLYMFNIKNIQFTCTDTNKDNKYSINENDIKYYYPSTMREQEIAQTKKFNTSQYSFKKSLCIKRNGNESNKKTDVKTRCNT